MFSDSLIALIVAAGAATFCYVQFGRRIGGGNQRRVWTVTGIVFVLMFILVIISIKFTI